MSLPFPQRSIPALERQAPCGGLTGEPNLSLPTVRPLSGQINRSIVRPLILTESTVSARFHLDQSTQ